MATETQTVENIDSLEKQITSAISSIRDGKKTPKQSGIGVMLNQLKAIDEPSYAKLLDEYKPVSAEYHKKHPNAVNKEKLIQREMAKIMKDLESNGDEDFISEDGEPRSKRGPSSAKPKSVNRERVAKVRPLHVPKEKKPKGERDRSAYKFNGEEYGKGPLVLAILRAHVGKNPGIGHDGMKKAFSDDLLRSYGIFKRLEEALEISKVRKRYFLKDDQLVELSDCKIAVCNQFTSDNIVKFLDQAKKLGYNIE